MTTNHTTITTSPETTEFPATNRARTPKAVSIAAAALLAGGVLFAGFHRMVSAPAQPTRTVEVSERSRSERELLEDLVNRGLVPAKALEPAQKSEREVLEDLVNRGLVPAKALEPAQKTEREVLEDLVNRGLVPAKSLEPAPVAEDDR